MEGAGRFSISAEVAAASRSFELGKRIGDAAGAGDRI
jgi:hypothetical protein